MAEYHVRSEIAARAVAADRVRFRVAPVSIRPPAPERHYRPQASREVVPLPITGPAIVRPQAGPADGPSRRAEAIPAALPRTGLDLPRQLPFDRWLSIGRSLAITASSSAWCLGDWLIYGETCYNGRYREAIERTSLEYKTLRNYAWVARKFPLSRRRETLSFGHHAEVAALAEPEQDFWLRKAEALGWSRNDIRREVHASLRERGVQDPAADGPPEPGADCPLPCSQLQIEVTLEQLTVIGQAASKAQLTVDAWATVTLERAARQEVRPLTG